MKNDKYLPAKIRRFNSNGTYTVEFTSGNRAVLDNVPPKYIKPSSSGSSPSTSQSPTRKRSASWSPLVNLANHHYDDENRHGARPSIAAAIKNSRGDDLKKLEKLLSRSTLAQYRDAFDQFDSSGSDELELEDVVDAFDSLGRVCSLKEIKTYVKEKVRSGEMCTSLLLLPTPAPFLTSLSFSSCS